ncbi:hypothetical protein Q9290_08780 [Oceanimonas sp. CHS3-5]|uniref:hypothetical protein n=1 Tax=Oceanimonas sp. CHS3-5 TaxID=3068186 RepID=UPI00274018D2|nr:hypothetical protein [Oceanimonas sp. CHS3-5]MDP5292380.1 hypothetical protein [Oceanimonas sp. CHS3-5]
MQLASTRPGAVQTSLDPAGGIAAAPGLADKADSSKALSGSPAGLSAPGRYQQWGKLSQAQSSVARLQAAEQSLSQAWQQLRTLAQRMQASTMSADQQQQWGEQLSRLSDQLQQQGRLDARLQPKALEGNAARHRFQLDKVDLLGVKGTRERITLLLAGQQQAMGITIRPGQRPADTLGQLNRHLKPLGIAASAEQGRVQLVATDRAEAILRQPILMQGEGVRVPAGEPVLIKPTPESDALLPLQQAARKGELASEREHLQRVLNHIQDYTARLQEQRRFILQQMSAEWPAVPTPTGEAPLGNRGSPFEKLVSALVAQANVARHNAVALLRKE